ncbi:MAG: hypothetical protein ACRDGD_08555 [Candidatus Limnocylindria bacterium]
MFGSALAQARKRGGGGPVGLVRKLVVLAFAVVQLVLVARILLDLGVVPADWGFSPMILTWSDALAAPVAGIVGSFGFGGFGGIPGGGVPGLGPSLGSGLNPVMLAALAGWTVVEGLVLGVVKKFAAV